MAQTKTLSEAVGDFLAQQRIAVAGVSRGGGFANAIYRRLRDTGHKVLPVNPNAVAVEGDACYPDIKSIPGGVDALFIATTPAAAESLVRECSETGVSKVWMHRSFGAGSVSGAAVRVCRENGITVIPGGCPLMFYEPVDFGHKCMRWVLRLTGGLPQAVS
ncbi:MAG: CoA-binding protein [Gemmatimonadales bacterium]